VTLYLDTSVLVKLYVAEPGSRQVRAEIDRWPTVATSVIAYVEARAALARRHRERVLSKTVYRQCIRQLEADWERYLRVEVSEPLVKSAAGIAEMHRLRAYDAIHLASALGLRERLRGDVGFASWDVALEAAARRSGLRVVERQ
jgi:predicted nucleic acid-binding protein